jgi:hypothetical protein
MIAELFIVLATIFHRSFGVILIQQGATKAEIYLARPYTRLPEFRKDLLGKNGYHNLDFSKITADEVGHLPVDIYSEINELQAKQMIKRYQEDLARGFNPVQFLNAFKETFGAECKRKGKTLEWLTTRDLDIFGYVPIFMPIRSLPGKLLCHLVKRWSVRKLTPLVEKELQLLDLKELVLNKQLGKTSIQKQFFLNLHSQQTVEHWPVNLKKLAAKSGVTPKSLNKNIGYSRITSSVSDDDDSKSLSDSNEDESESIEVDRKPRRRKPAGARRRNDRNRTSNRRSNDGGLNLMRRATSALLNERRDRV